MNPDWHSEILQRALEVAKVDDAVEQVTIEYLKNGHPVRVNLQTRPLDVSTAGGGAMRLPVLSMAIEATKRRRGPTWNQALYNRKYREAEREMRSPLEVNKMAARIGISEATFRHYYFADPPNGRYKTAGLGWGAAPACRAIGE